MITLARSDGQILARTDNFDKAATISIAGVPGLSPADAPAGEFRRVSTIDGVERFYRYQKVQRYPLSLSMKLAGSWYSIVLPKQYSAAMPPMRSANR